METQVRNQDEHDELDRETRLKRYKFVVNAYATWGETLHQLGRTAGAEEKFRKSVAMQEEASAAG